MSGWKEKDAREEIKRIIDFIRSYVQKEDQIVIAVSGGLDSDIVARLCCRSVGKERVRLFIVVQSEMDEKFLLQARGLAKELETPLAEIHLEHMNVDLMEALRAAEGGPIFEPGKSLDLAKAKCSVRSSVLSSYQDKGFLIAGTLDRSEKELGFFLTFGDNLAHFKPIAHLYKTELKALAKELGTTSAVIEQEASAGFWEGQTDIEDIAYWIVNDGPIVFPRDFTATEQLYVKKIISVLTQERIDTVLSLYGKHTDIKKIIECTGLTDKIVQGLIHIVEKAKVLKSRQLMVEME